MAATWSCGAVMPWAAVARHSVNSSRMSGSRSGSAEVSTGLIGALVTALTRSKIAHSGDESSTR
jgi:hypothetical protein